MKMLLDISKPTDINKCYMIVLIRLPEGSGPPLWAVLSLWEAGMPYECQLQTRVRVPTQGDLEEAPGT